MCRIECTTQWRRGLQRHDALKQAPETKPNSKNKKITLVSQFINIVAYKLNNARFHKLWPELTT